MTRHAPPRSHQPYPTRRPDPHGTSLPLFPSFLVDHVQRVANLLGLLVFFPKAFGILALRPWTPHLHEVGFNVPQSVITYPCLSPFDLIPDAQRSLLFSQALHKSKSSFALGIPDSFLLLASSVTRSRLPRALPATPSPTLSYFYFHPYKSSASFCLRRFALRVSILGTRCLTFAPSCIR